ncbi:MAG: 4-hydroxythreonine-4-phosphate dehydrogenase PdxA [Deltaproteobacteria bacterium]|nr:MAG: 4-hydroxythreonine-4-phosphate dehydrogenase PdxA [Deltaproteobacteria bacterium]
MLTAGDPLGIGPDLLLWLAAHGHLRSCDRVAADPSVLAARARVLPGGFAPEGIARLEAHLDPDLRATGADPAELLEAAVERVRAHPGTALVTGPIHKADMPPARFPFPGHTEFLAARDGGVPVTMAMMGPSLRVALVTVHLPLAEVPRHIDAAAVARAATHLAFALRDHLGIDTPRLGVCGLNPHAGEDGRFGNEERKAIAPGVERARAAAPFARFEGPLAADGAFGRAGEGAYDGLVAMYHDQGLAPFKLACMRDGVNVTLGLSFLRTSPDHGTARGLAGTGRIFPTSMLAAVRYARGDVPVWGSDA